MTFICSIFTIACMICQYVVDIFCCVLSGAGKFVPRINVSRCPRCRTKCERPMMLSPGCLTWCCRRSTGDRRCAIKLTAKCGLKIFVRTLHGALTVGVVTSLFFYKTGLQSAVESGNLIYCVSFFTVLVFSLAMYYAACFADPGYVPLPPRGKSGRPYDSDDDEGEETPEQATMLKGVKLRRCGFCGIQQPLRARHCEDCNRCVRKFDHHCPWLEACVGEGNHRFFLLFLLSKVILTIWVSAVSWQALEYHQAWREWLKVNIVLLMDLCVASAGAFIVMTLGGLHTYLMAVNQTTWELVSRERISYLKHLDDDLNPFHEGYCCNAYRFLCTRHHRKWEPVYGKNAALADSGV